MGLAEMLFGSGNADPAATPPAQSLASALNPAPAQPGMIGPPKSPDELAARTSMWENIQARLRSDPALQQAILAAGVAMAKGGARNLQAGIGQGVGAGMQMYNLSKFTEEENAKKAAEEARAQQTHDITMESKRQAIDSTSADMKWKQETRPLELEKLKAEIATMPFDAKRKKAEADLAALQTINEPARFNSEQAKIAASIRQMDASGAAAMMNARSSAASVARMSDQERAVAAYTQLPEVQALPPAQRAAAATSMYMKESRGVTSQMKYDQADQDAIYVAKWVRNNPTAPAVQLMDAKMVAQVARGEELLKQQEIANPGSTKQVTQGTAPNVPQPQGVPREVIRPVWNDKTKQFEMPASYSAGKIGGK
ncbi:MAG: hypothetical protein ABFD89_20005 [Bryobacteraceae bacterium]